MIDEVYTGRQQRSATETDTVSFTRPWSSGSDGAQRSEVAPEIAASEIAAAHAADVSLPRSQSQAHSPPP